MRTENYGGCGLSHAAGRTHSSPGAAGNFRPLSSATASSRRGARALAVSLPGASVTSSSLAKAPAGPPSYLTFADGPCLETGCRQPLHRVPASHGKADLELRQQLADALPTPRAVLLARLRASQLRQPWQTWQAPAPGAPNATLLYDWLALTRGTGTMAAALLGLMAYAALPRLGPSWLDAFGDRPTQLRMLGAMEGTYAAIFIGLLGKQEVFYRAFLRAKLLAAALPASPAEEHPVKLNTGLELAMRMTQATKRGDTAELAQLLDLTHGAIPDATLLCSYLDRPFDRATMSPLHAAIRYRQEDALALLLQHRVPAGLLADARAADSSA